MIKYDFSSLNKFLNEECSPEIMLEDIIKVVFNYIDNAHEVDMAAVRDDIGTLYLLYTQFSKIKPVQEEGGEA